MNPKSQPWSGNTVYFASANMYTKFENTQSTDKGPGGDAKKQWETFDDAHREALASLGFITE